jgi:hypothetical protein
MAEINMTVARINRVGGVNITTAKTACTSGNNYHVPNDGNVRLYYLSAAGGTSTIITPATLDNLAVADLTLTITNTVPFLFGPFPVNIYGADLVFSVSANTDVCAIGG